MPSPIIMRAIGRILRPWEYPEVLAFWDARYGVTQSANRVSAWASTLKGSITRSQGTGANQPIYLPYAGASYLWIPGVASNSVTAPPKALTGNWTLTIDFSMLSYTPGGDTTILSKTAANNGIILKWLNATAKPEITVGDGATLTTASPVSAPGWSANTRHTLKIVGQDGVGVTFFYDNVQSGNQVALAKTLADAAANWTIGASVGTLGNNIYSVSMVAASNTYSVDFTQCSETVSINGATFAQNGDTYTLNAAGAKPAQIITHPWVLHDAAAYYLSTGAITLIQPCGLISCMRHNTWVSLNELYDGLSAINTMAIYDRTSTPTLGMTAGLAACSNANLALSTKGVLGALFSGANSFNVVNQTAEVTGSAGTANPGGLVSGCRSDATAFGALQETALALINQACTPARYRQIIASMQREYA